MGAIPANIHWGAQTLTAGDVLLVSGTLGDHGATILNLREQLGLDGELVSDCAVLTPLIQTLRDIPGVKALRDATRGGVNAVVHEFAAACGCGIEISEAALPVKPAVRGVCELLGLDALNFANEGKLVIAVERNAAEQVLAALHSHPLGKDAALIGEVVERKGVRLAGLYGVKRTLDRDATRGGVNAVVHEFAAACGCGIELSEAALPVKPAVRGVCELLGLDALNFANEGKLVIAVERNAAEQVLAALHSHTLGIDAALICEVVERKGVRLAGIYGVKRTLYLPHAEPLP